MALEAGEGSASHPCRTLPWERPSTHCTGGWVCSSTGMNRCKISRPTGIRSPDLPARSHLLYRLSYLAEISYVWQCRVVEYTFICIYIYFTKRDVTRFVCSAEKLWWSLGIRQSQVVPWTGWIITRFLLNYDENLSDWMRRKVNTYGCLTLLKLWQQIE